ncbi:hypothetical protein ILUMI_26025 [Ignelater luminosus]|uniref:Uncharacterized protein n=1 Tax=Ignelater luminosus TaxID=2038154 RepID=A0A8K0C9C2_IGNLU|nr:hypothetical protein ILUMI_26025 [Ignelater luminosus]
MMMTSIADNSIIIIKQYCLQHIQQHEQGRSHKPVLVILDCDVLHGYQIQKLRNPKLLPHNYNVERSTRNVVDTSLASVMHIPIARLTPYLNKWVIKACITHKSGICNWSNLRGKG